MKLSIRAFALTAALLWGGGILLVALANLVWPAYGKAFLELCSSVYPGYHATSTARDALVGAAYGVLDGAACGAVFAWLYNLLAGEK